MLESKIVSAILGSSTKETSMTAYDKGYEAFLYGDSDKENPYDFGTDNYDEWLNGWCSAAAGH
jgi:ribosome modulation factor